MSRHPSPVPGALRGVQLGLGLTQLGRPWGYRPAPVPTEDRAFDLLEFAVDAGVRTFDTAPSYGRSERRLGAFLRTLPAARRKALVIATKCGELWDEEAGQPVVDHGFDSLLASVERSLSLLGDIDLVQLHRAGPEVLRSRDVRRALSAALALGVSATGASVSDMESARIAVCDLGVSALQFPYHRGNVYMAEAFRLAADHGCAVIVNRSLGMGRLTAPVRSSDPRSVGTPPARPVAAEASPDDAAGAIADAYRFVLESCLEGVVLTGTSSVSHLAMDIECFARARDAGPPAGRDR